MEDLSEVLSPEAAWALVLDRLKSRASVPSLNPMGGMDNAPVSQAPVVPTPPWTFHLGGNEATLSLPANHGANFEGYVNYHFNPFSPQDFRLDGGGLRYRYSF